MTRSSQFLAASLLAVAIAAAACGSPDTAEHRTTGTSAPVPELTYDAHGEPEGLHHFRRWSDRVYQGAQPHGDVAFRNLAAMGVRTVVSVDGARPDLESASKYGLRYVHVPIGYHGPTRAQQIQIVKAVEDSDGPAFVHCHHGKHRGPAAAAMARMALDGVTPETAVEGLVASGCNPKYAGLYSGVAAFVAPTAAELASVTGDLPEYVRPAAMVDAMVDVDFRAANLDECRNAGWSVPEDNPDVSPPHEARMLWEHYRELARLDESKKRGVAFITLLQQSEDAARALEASLRAHDAVATETAWSSVKDGCNTCHKSYRNNR